MSIADARDLEPGTEISTEFCVVGAGAAGITVALVLAEAGRDVCIVESGGLRLESETQDLQELISTGYPLRENFVSRARCFGGSCELWAGRCMRLEEIDLRIRGWIPDSGWPITHAELARQYSRAAELLELPPIGWLSDERWVAAASKDERRLLEGPLAPRIALWARHPLRFGSKFRRQLTRSDRVQVLLHANAVRIQLGADGRDVQSLAVRTLRSGRTNDDHGSQTRIRARTFVLACGGLENARLLLASRDVQHHGIGNQFGTVGRFLMDHPRAVYGRVRLNPGRRVRLARTRPVRDGRVQLGFGPTPELQAREQLLNHYVTFESEHSEYVRTEAVPRVATFSGPAPEPAHFARRLRTAVVDLARWRAVEGGRHALVYFCEQPPDAHSEVTLSRERDALGVPRLELNWRISAEVTRSLLRLEEILARALEDSGVGVLEPGVGPPDFTDASHHMGTTRMSASPRTGVVDADCRVHVLANLFVAGSSVFATAGHANPTLTIVALALRLADRLVRE